MIIRENSKELIYDLLENNTSITIAIGTYKRISLHSDSIPEDKPYIFASVSQLVAYFPELATFEVQLNILFPAQILLIHKLQNGRVIRCMVTDDPFIQSLSSSCNSPLRIVENCLCEFGFPATRPEMLLGDHTLYSPNISQNNTLSGLDPAEVSLSKDSLDIYRPGLVNFLEYQRLGVWKVTTRYPRTYQIPAYEPHTLDLNKAKLNGVVFIGTKETQALIESTDEKSFPWVTLGSITNMKTVTRNLYYSVWRALKQASAENVRVIWLERPVDEVINVFLYLCKELTSIILPQQVGLQFVTSQPDQHPTSHSGTKPVIVIDF